MIRQVVEIKFSGGSIFNRFTPFQHVIHEFEEGNNWIYSSGEFGITFWLH